MSKSFGDAFGSWLDEAFASLPAAEEPGGSEPPQITVTKASGWIPVSEEILMDEGIIPDTRPRPPLRRRLRWRLAARREWTARLAYRAIAGEWPYEPGDDD